MLTLGQRILHARKKLGWNQHVLGQRVGTSGPIIGRYERGEIKPSFDVVKRISEALGVTLDYLVGEDQHPSVLQDKAMLERMRQIEHLDEHEKECFFFVIDGLLRDAQARRAYAQATQPKAREMTKVG